MIKNVAESLRVARLAKSKPHMCWENASNMLFDVNGYDDADYVEGIIVIPGNVGSIQEHAWVERAGEIIDPTQPDRDLRYFPALRCEGQFKLFSIRGECGLPLCRSLKFAPGRVCPELEAARRLAQEWLSTNLG